MQLTRSGWLHARPHATLAIFRALQIGDMLCAVPALRALRSALPDTRITLVGLPWAEQFAARFHRYVDEFIPFPGHAAFPEQAVQQHRLADFYSAMRARRFDIALQMHGSGELSNLVTRAFGARTLAGFGDSGGHPSEHFTTWPEHGEEPLRLLQLTSALGAPACGEQLEFPLTDADERELGASGLATGLEPYQYICIHPGARDPEKCWPTLRFSQVADRLADEYGLPIVLTGAASEGKLTAAVARRMRHRAVDTAAPISVGAMAALISRARLIICNDTGVSHIAAGLKVPSVVIFSKADMRRWAPLDKQRHHCLWDARGERMPEVIAHARRIMQAHPVR
jgi:ADP-heptose:LPS heptosyltransferase